MPAVNETFEVDAPIEQVWQLLTDFNRYATWHPLIKGVTLDGPLQSGTRATLSVPLKAGGEPKPVQVTFAEVEAPRTLTWVGGLGPKWLARGYHYHRLEALPSGGTRVTHGEEFSGLLFLLLWPLQEKSFAITYKQTSEAIKQHFKLAVI